MWPCLLLLNIFPALFSLIILPFLPDSPRYLLLVKQKRLAAEKGLLVIKMRLHQALSRMLCIDSFFETCKRFVMCCVCMCV